MIDTTGMNTLFDVLKSTREHFGAEPAFVYRASGEEFTVTYEKFFEDVVLLARAFRSKKIRRGSKVMVLADNRYAWIVTDFALMSIGAIGVPRGVDTTTPELEYILEHAECDFLVAETPAVLEMHAELIENSDLTAIFIMEAGHVHKRFGTIWSFNDLLENRTLTGEEIDAFITEGDTLTEDDTLTLIYTSGTTGTPKGVVLTHRNIMHNIRVIPGIADLGGGEVWVSVLPPWHIFERVMEYLSISHGGKQVYSSIKTFSADIEQYRPTIVATVPRLWESMYQKIHAALEKQGTAKLKIFKLLVATSKSFRRNARIIKNQLPVFKKPNPVANLFRKLYAGLKVTLLFLPYKLAMRRLSAVQAKFGGRLRLAVSGGGALPDYLDEWIDAVGIRIVNAYGMTECAPGIAGRALNCEIFATLGPPIPGTELRIVSEDGTEQPPGVEGEIHVRGPQVMPGYYNNPEENEISFTEDGFFRTGDLGKMTLTGELVITGRIKEIIVLATGENIDPTRIESAIATLPFVKDAVLVGQDKKGLAALIVPDLEKIGDFFSNTAENVVYDFRHFMNEKDVVDRAKKEINRLLAPKKGFKSYEKLINLSFLDREFKPGVEITNTLKKRRHQIEKSYQDIIKKLFK